MSDIEAVFEDLKGTFIGIDLGTTNTVVSYFRDRAFDQVRFRNQKTLPSAIFFEQDGDVIFGDKALKKGVSSPNQLLREFKRDLGTNKKYTITFPEVTSSVDVLKKTFVIDTNIFIHQPDILERFISDDHVILIVDPRVKTKILTSLRWSPFPQLNSAAPFLLSSQLPLVCHNNPQS